MSEPPMESRPEISAKHVESASRLGWPAALVIAILTLAGIFDALSGNPIHGVLLIGAAAVLVREAVRSPDPRSTNRGLTVPAPPGWILIMTGLLYAVLIGEFGRYSWPATVAVLAPGAAALFLAWRAPERGVDEAPAITLRGALSWAGVFVTLGLWELVQLLLQPSLSTDSYAHPTISVLSDPVLASDLGRAIVLFAWLAFGWFLVRA
jgi:hypothetical protein